MLLSPPVLLLGLTKLGGSLNFYMMLTELPSYLNFMYGIKIDDVSYPTRVSVMLHRIYQHKRYHHV